MAVLKQKTPLQRKTPLRTTKPMARGTKQLQAKAPLKASKPMARSTKPIKKRAPKMTPIRASARGEDCTMRIPGVCCGDRETVVWAHSNDSRDGKGMGLKSRDREGCYACLTCHATYDRQMPRPPGLTKEDIDVYFARGRCISRQILQRKGLIDE